ncbi:uncharacterized protein LOC112572483 isoform X2 [Pomacea canaliculata]|uniref:uncharacterized protein LOC112572483 isoform X2 n=1 Tax=Pomacea canaliculata TaxID=400727 RepID=UPI000D73AC1C|nr:uncharacterized protein LOC112572483 isoform X2 [Pomacea canaliculata]
MDSNRMVASGFACLVFYILPAAVTDSICSCQSYTSCNFSLNDFQPSRLRNVAIGKPTKMSSQLNSSVYNQTSGPPCLAVDDKTEGIFRPINQFPDSPNCIHTGDNDREPYWEVNLGEPYAISSIIIYWRSTDLARSNGVNVTVDGQLCYTFQGPAVTLSSNIICDTWLTGQTVRLSKADMTLNHYFLTLCEIEVMVCCPGYFGRECQEVCPEPVCKNNQVCSPVDGTCPQVSSPSDNDMTKVALPVVGSLLACCILVGLIVAIVFWLKRARNHQHEPTTRPQSRIVYEGCAETFQIAFSPDYINTRWDKEVPMRTGNAFNPFPRHTHEEGDSSALGMSSLDKDVYEEVNFPV